MEFIIGAIDLSENFIEIGAARIFVFEGVPLSVIEDLIRFSRMNAPLKMPLWVSRAGRTHQLYSIWHEPSRVQRDLLHFNLHTLSGAYFCLAFENKGRK